MNIFYLDEDPSLAALYHNDKHVIAMTKEAAQMLSTAHWYFDNEVKDVCKPTHVNHPCNVWIRESANNYRWLFDLYCGLARQYSLRYDNIHWSYRAFWERLAMPPQELVEKPMTPVALVMPDQYKQDNPVEAYRAFYIGEKKYFSSWLYPAKVPPWFK